MSFRRSYWIVLAALGATCAVPCQRASATDECEDAQVIAPNSTTNFDTAGATPSSNPYDPSQCPNTYFSATGPDIWFRVQLPNSGTLVLSTCRPGGYDTDLSLYAGSCMFLLPVACNGDAPSASGCQPYYSRIEYDVTAPGDYFIRVGGYNGTIGLGRLTSIWDPAFPDCDQDGVPDDQEPDCDGNGVPDDCESDCDQNGVPDVCETYDDCNDNGIPDVCDLTSGWSSDLNLNGILDECEAIVFEVPFILNATGGICLPSGPIELEIDGTLLGVKVEFSFTNMDEYTWASDLLLCVEQDDDEGCIQIGSYNIDCSNDCRNTIDLPEAWRVTTNGDYETYLPLWGFGLVGDSETTVKICHGYSGASQISIWNGTLTFVSLPGDITDCNGNGTPDEDDINSGESEDCNENGVPDECDVSDGISTDIDHNGVPDTCQYSDFDDCDTAIRVTPDSVTFFSTLYATNSGLNTNDLLCPNTYFSDCEPDLWFEVELPQMGTLLVHTCNAESFDTDLALLVGDKCQDLIQIACSGDADNAPQCQEFYSLIEIELDPGLYYIRVGGYLEAIGVGMLSCSFTPGAPPCPSDLNHDGNVNGADIGLLIAAWGACGGCPADLNGDGIVNGADVGQFLSGWGPCL